MVFCRIERNLEVISLARSHHKASIVHRHLTLPLIRACSFRYGNLPTSSHGLDLRICDLTPVTVCKPEADVVCLGVLPHVGIGIRIKSIWLLRNNRSHLAFADHDTLHCNCCSSRESAEVKHELEVRNICSCKTSLNIFQVFICSYSNGIVVEELVDVSRIAIAVEFCRMLPARLDCSCSVIGCADDCPEIISLVCRDSKTGVSEYDLSLPFRSADSFRNNESILIVPKRRLRICDLAPRTVCKPICNSQCCRLPHILVSCRVERSDRRSLRLLLDVTSPENHLPVTARILGHDYQLRLCEFGHMEYRFIPNLVRRNVNHRCIWRKRDGFAVKLVC